MNTNEQQPDDKLTMKGSFNFLLYGAQVHAACVWPFLRLGMGVEALRWHGPAAFVLLCLFAGASQSMLIYLAVWFVFVARQRIKADPGASIRGTRAIRSWRFAFRGFGRRKKPRRWNACCACWPAFR